MRLDLVVFFFIFPLIKRIQCVEIANVTLFEHIGYEGKSISLHEIIKCENVALDFNDKASSVDTHGGCIMLCAHANCQGRCVRVAPETAGRFNLWALDINEEVTSLKPCGVENIQYIPVQSERSRNVVTDITFYKHESYTGEILRLQGITSCVSIPAAITSQTRSVETNSSCVMICESPDCSKRCVGISPFSKGRYSLQDLNMDRTISFIKPCYHTNPDSYIYFKYQKYNLLAENSTHTLITILREARSYRQRGIMCGDGIDLYGKYWAVCEGQIVERHCAIINDTNQSLQCSEIPSITNQSNNCNCKFAISKVEILDKKNDSDFVSNDSDKILSELNEMINIGKYGNSGTGHKLGLKEIEKICQIASDIPISTNANSTVETVTNLTSKSLNVITSVMTNQDLWAEMHMDERRQGFTNLINSMETTVFNFAKTREKNEDLPRKETREIRANGIVIGLGSENLQPQNNSMLYFSDQFHSHETYISVPISHLDNVDKLEFFGAAIPSTIVENQMNSTLISLSDNGSLLEDSTKKLNGKTVTFSIMGRTYLQLKEDVKIVFSHNVQSIGETKQKFRRRLHHGERRKAVFGNAQCAFWDTKKLNDLVEYVKERKWSTDGCRRSLSDSNSFLTTCVCNHLTTFSILMDFHEYEAKDAVLQILTWTLCSISMISLLITLVVFLSLKITKSSQTKITANLCATLIIGNLLLIATDRENFPLSDSICTLFGVLNHYVWLSVFGWMAVEGFHLYREVVKVYHSQRSELLKLYSLAVYGIPVIIVSMTAVLGFYLEDRSVYVGEVYCWLTGKYRYSFIIPVSLVLLGNFVVLVKVLCIASKHRQRYVVNITPQTREEQKKAFKKLIKGTLSLSVLLGLTWIIGFFSMVDSSANYYLELCFVVLNASQGIFIFIFHLCMNKTIRSQLYKSISNSWPLTMFLLESSNATTHSHTSTTTLPALEKLLYALHGIAESTIDEKTKLVTD